MNVALICLMVIFGAMILIPVGISVYSSIDYKRQISGKKKMRTLKGEYHINPDQGPDQTSVEMDLIAVTLKTTMSQSSFH